MLLGFLEYSLNRMHRTGDSAAEAREHGADEFVAELAQGRARFVRRKATPRESQHRGIDEEHQ